MSIYYNQLGYLEKDKKHAVMTCPGDFFLFDKEQNQIIKKEAKYLGYDSAAAEKIWHLDFSEITQEGEYYLTNEYGDKTAFFCIKKTVYTDLRKHLVKAFYYQRCGCELEEKEAGVFKRPPCHKEKASLYVDKKQKIDTTGGWHDAGDYGKYVTAASTALAHLLYANILFPDQFEETEERNIPYILEECRYEINWLFKMQAEEGGVYHKVTSIRHANFVMPHEDKRELFVFPISSMATGAFAGIMALAYRIYQYVDKKLAERALAAAEKAWEWLDKNPYFIGFHNPDECNTGGYDDVSDTDERMWAAAELWKSTHQECYLDALEKYMDATPKKTAFGWQDVGGFAGLAMLFPEMLRNREDVRRDEKEKNDRDYKIKKCFQKEFLREADIICEIIGRSCYGVALNPEEYTWGSNMTVLTRGMQLCVAYILSNEETYKEYAKEQLHYILGKNALGISYVTGAGSNSFENPHNRVTVADGIEQTIPGFVAGGPNRSPVDEKAEWILLPGTAPMKSYFDIWECYSLNEITIYWNSCAVFLAALE